MPVTMKRAYEEPGRDDGYRVLVDGLWPRGRKKEDLALDEWMKEIAPSAGLRKWYGHDPDKWEEFRKRYRAELQGPPRRELLEALRKRARRRKVTLVYGAHEGDISNAAVLAELIGGKPRHNKAA